MGPTTTMGKTRRTHYRPIAESAAASHPSVVHLSTLQRHDVVSPRLINAVGSPPCGIRRSSASWVTPRKSSDNDASAARVAGKRMWGRDTCMGFTRPWNAKHHHTSSPHRGHAKYQRHVGRDGRSAASKLRSADRQRIFYCPPSRPPPPRPCNKRILYNIIINK